MRSVVVLFAIGICLWSTRPALGQDRKPNKQEYIEAAQRWSYPLGRSGYRADLPTGSDPELWQKVVKQREANIAHYREQIKKAERGEYTTERTITYVDADGRTRETRVLENHNGTMMMLANNALLTAQGQTPDAAYFAGKAGEYKKYMLARMEYWRTVLPEVATQFAGQIATRPIVSLRFDPSYKSQADETYWANYLVKNISGKELHNVTLVVKLYHFSTGDAATAHQVYFEPSWKPNRELELSHEFVPVEDNPAIRYYVPKTLKPNQAPNPELAGIGGVVRMDLVVFCDEYRQPAHTVKLPQRVAKVVPELLAIAEDGIRQGHQLGLPGVALPGRAQNLRPQPANPQDAKAALDRFKAEILAPALVPILQCGDPKSPEFRKALQYLDDPLAARAALQNTAQTELLTHFAPGQQYESNVAEKFNARRIGIIFLKCNADGTAIQAELYDPDSPQLTRRVRGQVVVDRRKNQPLVFLNAAGPATQRVPPARNVGFGGPARMKLDPFEPSCQSFALFWTEGRLMMDVAGPLTAEQAAAGFSLLPSVPLEAKPADPKQRTDALKRAADVEAKSPTKEDKR